MTDDTGSEPYGFDFFETIVGISFPSGGYILVTVTAITSVNNPNPPPQAGVSFGALPKGVKLIDKDQRLTHTSEPAKDTVTPVYFVFNDVAGPVTLGNYQNVINASVFPPVLFATQFARSVGSPTGFKEPESFGVEPVPEGGDGFFSTAAIAQGYANSWNAHIHGAPAGSGAAVYLSDGSTADANPAPVSVHHLDVPHHSPGAASTTLIARYLFKVPKEKTTITATVTAHAGSSSTVITGYHGKVPTSVTVPVPGLADSDGVAGAGENGNYTMTSEITKTAAGTVNNVTISAGSGPTAG